MRNFIALTFTVLLLAIPAGQAQALVGLGGCTAASIAGSFVSSFVTVPTNDPATGATAAKECILDGLSTVIAEAIIATITEGIVQWINNGFDDAPAFVTDLDAFMQEVSDNTALDFLEGSALHGLCSPFNLEIRIALALDYQRKSRPRCSLSDATDNIEEFLSGDFSKGGWPAWFRVNIDPYNSPYGAYVSSKNELLQAIALKQEEEVQLLSFGDGFFSKKRCVRYEETSAQQASEAAPGTTVEDGKTCAEYEIVTPGTQINDTLSSWMGLGAQKLALADEIDEIVNALIYQLSREAITGARGLLGLSERSSGSSQPPFIERLRLEAQTSAQETTEETFNYQIGGLKTAEQNYRTTVQGALQEITVMESRLTAALQCYQDTGLFIGDQELVTAMASSTLASITQTKERYSDELEKSIAIDESLSELSLTSGETLTNTELNRVFERYDELISIDTLHSSTDIAEIQNELEGLRQTIASLANESGICSVEFE